MKNVLAVLKKEFARFFRDKRLVVGTLILPGLLIFVLYTVLGSVIYSPAENYTVLAVRPSAAFSALLDESAFTVTEIGEEEIGEAKKEVLGGSADLLAVFPENFDDLLSEGVFAPVGQAPNVELWYDSSSVSSSSA